MNNLIIIAILFFAGCTYKPLAGSSNDGDIEGDTGLFIDRTIHYFRDKRTGLCFAGFGVDRSYSFTNVPCEKVETLIEK